ncbi:MetQ/NlpA family ABC transporter substrate-binding protein [Weissella hellenica]|uniref:MetQ/NlpA family ABC transporter substrate-binding protein n=1 Tax=Weissella hellenica TaxID=46256 RepID=UPI00388824EB
MNKTTQKKYNLTVKTKVFTDYNQPNKAVADGSLDLNAFQHVYFLNNWNKSNDNKVKAIGKTFITPIRLYSEKYKDVKDFKKGDSIAVPNDSTNEGRALTLLQSAGLIKIKKGVDLPTLKDIKSNKLNLKFKEVAADQGPSSLKSMNGAVINTNYAQEAKLKLNSAVYVEPINKKSKQWINVIVARKSDADKKAYKQVVKTYQSKQTKQYLKDTWGKAEIPAWDIKLK